MPGTDKRPGSDTTNVTTAGATAKLLLIDGAADQDIAIADLETQFVAAAAAAGAAAGLPNPGIDVPGDGVKTVHVITHNLNTRYVDMLLFDHEFHQLQGYDAIPYEAGDPLNQSTFTIDAWASTTGSGPLPADKTWKAFVTKAGAVGSGGSHSFSHLIDSDTGKADAIQAAFDAGTITVGGLPIHVASYHEGSDIGGGWLRPVASATGTDDGGSYIDFTGFQLEAIFADDSYSVARWGGSPSLADNAATTQAAIDFAGGGRYTISWPLADGVWNYTTSVDYKNCNLKGTGKPGNDSTSGGTTLVFAGTTGLATSLANNNGIQHENLLIVGSSSGNRPADNGQVLVDLRKMNSPSLKNVRVAQAGTGILLEEDVVEANYTHFDDVDVYQCSVGIENQGNSFRMFGGRLWQCRTGVLVPQGATQTYNNLLFSGVTFEAIQTAGVDSTSINAEFAGCRFENPDIELASVVIRASSGVHMFNGNHWSSGLDILDQTIGGVAYGTDFVPTSPVRSVSSSRNRVSTPTLDIDTSIDGVADDWSYTFTSNEAGATPTIDTSVKVSGAGSQRLVNVDAVNARIGQTIATVDGRHYVAAIRARVEPSGSPQVSFRIGSTTLGTNDLGNIEVPADGAWHLLTRAFQADSGTTQLCVYNSGADAADIHLDYAHVTAGIALAPDWDEVL